MWIYKILIYGGVILKKAMIYVHGKGGSYLEADDKARALHLRTYIALGTKAGSTDLENAEKD